MRLDTTATGSYAEEYRERHHPWPQSASGDARAPTVTLRLEADVAFDALIDVFDFGIVVCDVDGRVRVANQAAMAVLAAHDGIALQSGRLAIADAAARRKFATLLMAPAMPSQPRKSAGEAPAALLIPRPSRQAAYRLIARRMPARRTMPSRSAGSLWAVVLLDPSRQSDFALRALASIYGFTAAETRLAGFLVEGASLEATADRTGLKVSTLRTQLRALLQKTGTRRQAELVALLCRIPALR